MGGMPGMGGMGGFPGMGGMGGMPGGVDPILLNMFMSDPELMSERIAMSRAFSHALYSLPSHIVQACMVHAHAATARNAKSQHKYSKPNCLPSTEHRAARLCVAMMAHAVLRFRWAALVRRSQTRRSAQPSRTSWQTLRTCRSTWSALPHRPRHAMVGT